MLTILSGILIVILCGCIMLSAIELMCLTIAFGVLTGHAMAGYETAKVSLMQNAKLGLAWLVYLCLFYLSVGLATTTLSVDLETKIISLLLITAIGVSVVALPLKELSYAVKRNLGHKHSNDDTRVEPVINAEEMQWHL